MFESQVPNPEPDPAESLKSPLASVSYVTLAAMLGVKEDTLERWVRSGKIRQPIYFGRLARWPIAVAKKIVAEGTQAAGTYPPKNGPVAAKLKKLPKNVTNTLGYNVTTDKVAKKVVRTHKPPTPKKRRGKS